MKEFCKENRIVLIGLGLSLFHWTLATAFCIALLYYLKEEKIRGGIKILIILGIRTNLGKSIASSFGIGGVIKLGVIFFVAFYILFYAHPKNQNRLNKILGLLSIYLLFNILTLFLISSFPITGLFKLASYAIPFYAILRGIGDDDKYDYIAFMLKWFSIILICSLMAIPFGRFNYVNGDFQGILKHPNTFGLFGAVFAGLLVYQFAIGKINIKQGIWIYLGLLDILLLCLSRSRTGLFASLILLVTAFCTTREMSINRKIAWSIILIVLLISFVRFSVKGMEAVERFARKRGETTFLQSREEMKIDFERKFAYSPWLGTGFLVPFYRGYKDYSLHFDLVAEPGNLYYAVVGDSGVIGGILFILYITYIFWCGGKHNYELALIPIIISMGEVAFFSTNNLAVWYYVIFGVCMSSKEVKNNLYIKYE